MTTSVHLNDVFSVKPLTEGYSVKKVIEILNLDEIKRRLMVILVTREMLTKMHLVFVNDMRK